MIRVGIIGNGFVGSAHANVFRHYADVKVFDVDTRRSPNEWQETVNQDIVFLCLPTPMNRDGQVNRNIVERTLYQLCEDGLPTAVILKSTLPPADLLELDAKYGHGPLLIFSPEFLTERSAEYDLQQSTRFIFGHEHARYAAIDLVSSLFELRFPQVPCYWVPLETAALVKYFTNVFFASKVGILNEFHRIAGSFGIDPDQVRELVMLDPRIGKSHFQVPGHDGVPGWGGSCFLKDMNAYVQLARQQGQSARIVEAVWHSNVEVRGAELLARELSGMVGRAITEPIDGATVERLVT